MWESVTKETRTTKRGGTTSINLVPITSKELPEPVVVELYKSDYDTLRIMYLTGIKEFNATYGVAKEGGFAPILFSGALAK